MSLKKGKGKGVHFTEREREREGEQGKNVNELEHIEAYNVIETDDGLSFKWPPSLAWENNTD